MNSAGPIESEVVDRFVAAGIPQQRIAFARDTYVFHHPAPPSDFVSAFREFYGPTMNAFAAAEQSGRADDLARELNALFASHNQSGRADATSIPATFLRVTVSV